MHLLRHTIIITADDNTAEDAAISEDVQSEVSGINITNENNPTGENDSSEDKEFSSGGSSNDLNLDLDGDRGRHAIRRAQNQDLNRKVVDAHDTRSNGPDIAYQIPERLYAKAAKQNADLADDERALLFSLGDVFGKTLAHPDSLTVQEMHQVMYWPPPDEMRALIQRATGGALSTPGELIAKPRRQSSGAGFRRI